MKTLVIILIMAAFLQTTILPIDLVLLILICKAYLKADKANLYLAFAFGLLTAHLNLSNLGLQALVYLVIVLATQILAKLRLAGNPLLIVPLAFVLLSLSQIADFYINHQIFQFSAVLIASILSLPILFLIKLWEERFTAQKEIKLKI